MNKERQSNYELMRIISMFLIVIYHVIIHGHVITNYNNEGAKIIAELIVYASIIHVNSFVLLSGYFQSTSKKINQTKIWKIINQSLFYRILIVLIFTIFNLASFDKITILKEFFPIDTIEYWYIKCYLLLYILSPFINKSIENFDKKSFQKLLLTLFLIFSVLANFTGGQTIFNNGYNILNFIFLYLIGAYLRRYPLENCYLFKPMSKRLFQLTLLFLFIFFTVSNFINVKYFSSLMGINTIFEEIGTYIQSSSLAYSNPLIIFQSISYFVLFGTLNIKNKFINKLSSLTLGVYFIHDNNFIRNIIYSYLKINVPNITSYKFIFYIILIAIIIYVVCSIIELLRQGLFNLIYNLKITEKLRKKYYKVIHEIKMG